MNRAADLRGKTVVVFAASPWAPFIDTYRNPAVLAADDLKVRPSSIPRRCGHLYRQRAERLMSTVGRRCRSPSAAPSKCLLASDAGIAFRARLGWRAKTPSPAISAALRRLIQVERAVQHLCAATRTTASRR